MQGIIDKLLLLFLGLALYFTSSSFLTPIILFCAYPACHLLLQAPSYRLMASVPILFHYGGLPPHTLRFS